MVEAWRAATEVQTNSISSDSITHKGSHAVSYEQKRRPMILVLNPMSTAFLKTMPSPKTLSDLIYATIPGNSIWLIRKASRQSAMPKIICQRWKPTRLLNKRCSERKSEQVGHLQYTVMN